MIYLPIDLKHCTPSELKDIIYQCQLLLDSKEAVSKPDIEFKTHIGLDKVISMRLYNILKYGLGIARLSEIEQFTLGDVMRLRNMGRHTMTELEKVMEKYRFKFKDM